MARRRNQARTRYSNNRKGFEAYYEREMLPRIARDYEEERRGIDRRAREQAWHDAVKGWVGGGYLPRDALRWQPPERLLSKRVRATTNPRGRYARTLEYHTTGADLGQARHTIQPSQEHGTTDAGSTFDRIDALARQVDAGSISVADAIARARQIDRAEGTLWLAMAIEDDARQEEAWRLAENPYQGDAVELAKYRKAREAWERSGRRGPPPVHPKRRTRGRTVKAINPRIPRYRVSGNDNHWKDWNKLPGYTDHVVLAKFQKKPEAMKFAKEWMAKHPPMQGVHAHSDGEAYVEVYNDSRGMSEQSWRGVDGKWLDPDQYVEYVVARRDKNPPRQKMFEPGDLVRYTAKFKKTIGRPASSRIDGVVVGVNDWSIGPWVLWNDRDAVPTSINAINIEKAKTSRSKRDLLLSAGGALGLPLGQPSGKWKTYVWTGRWSLQSTTDTRQAAFDSAEKAHYGESRDQDRDTVVLDPEGYVALAFDSYKRANPQGRWTRAQRRAIAEQDVLAGGVGHGAGSEDLLIQISESEQRNGKGAWHILANEGEQMLAEDLSLDGYVEVDEKNGWTTARLTNVGRKAVTKIRRRGSTGQAVHKRAGRSTRQRTFKNVDSNHPDYHRRNLILPKEVLDDLVQWHGSQGSALYSLASMAQSEYVSPSMIDAAVADLEHIEARTRDKRQRKEFDALIGDLDAFARYSDEHTTKEAGLGDVDSGYATWLMEESVANPRRTRQPRRNPSETDLRTIRSASKLARGG